jgi:beta-mannosidase
MFTRKPGFHYGWDWGPRFVSSGIWKDVSLTAWSKAKVHSLWVRQEELNKNTAKLIAQFEIEAVQQIEADLFIEVEGKRLSKKVKLSEGLNTLKVPFEITNPIRWWPNGMGDQKLYKIQAVLKNRE